MSSMDEDRPAPYHGEHPDDAPWSLVAPEGSELSLEGEFTVEGSELRVMWDEGAGPLWASDGLLPDDPEWLRRALGLRDSLVADLVAWAIDMNAPHASTRVADRRARRRQLRQTGRLVADRVQAEVGPRFRVRFHG